MQIKEKEFNIFAGERPKVLLLGNGLCRAYGGMSWDQLLDEIKDQNAFPHPACEYVMPMPLKAAMLANNTLSKQLRKIVAEDSGGRTQQQQTSWHSGEKPKGCTGTAAYLASTAGSRVPQRQAIKSASALTSLRALVLLAVIYMLGSQQKIIDEMSRF